MAGFTPQSNGPIKNTEKSGSKFDFDLLFACSFRVLSDLIFVYGDESR